MVLWADHSSSSVCGDRFFGFMTVDRKLDAGQGGPAVICGNRKRAIQNRHSFGYAGFVRLWREREAPPQVEYL